MQKCYYNLYSEGEAKIDREEILKNTDMLTKINEEDANKLDRAPVDSVGLSIKCFGNI